MAAMTILEEVEEMVTKVMKIRSTWRLSGMYLKGRPARRARGREGEKKTLRPGKNWGLARRKEGKDKEREARRAAKAKASHLQPKGEENKLRQHSKE